MRILYYHVQHAEGSHILVLCIEFISIPGGCDAFEVYNVSAEEAESVELSDTCQFCL